MHSQRSNNAFALNEKHADLNKKTTASLCGNAASQCGKAAPPRCNDDVEHHEQAPAQRIVASPLAGTLGAACAGVRVRAPPCGFAACYHHLRVDAVE